MARGVVEGLSSTLRRSLLVRYHEMHKQLRQAERELVEERARVARLRNVLIPPVQ